MNEIRSIPFIVNQIIVYQKLCHNVRIGAESTQYHWLKVKNYVNDVAILEPNALVVLILVIELDSIEFSNELQRVSHLVE